MFVYKNSSLFVMHDIICLVFFPNSVGTASPGWDASLSEHVLKNLRGTDMPFSEKDLQDNLTMLEVKLR